MSLDCANCTWYHHSISSLLRYVHPKLKRCCIFGSKCYIISGQRCIMDQLPDISLICINKKYTTEIQNVPVWSIKHRTAYMLDIMMCYL